MAKRKRPARTGPARGPVKVVVGVPGTWLDAQAAQQALLERHGLLFAGDASVLIDTNDPEAPDPLVVEAYDRDPHLRRAFELAGGGRLPPELLARLDGHTRTLYLVDDEAGTLEAAERLLKTAVKLLDAGGLAVKVETAGLAHGPEAWRELAGLPLGRISLLHAFVLRLLDPEAGQASSIGMHALGLPDVRTAPGQRDHDEALRAVQAFALYQLVEAPDLRDGHTFAREAGAPRWLLKKGRDDRQDEDPGHLLRNPFGLWTLAPA